MSDPGDARPIIVLGCPRSGTTLLQTMLHSHPRIAIPPETRFLLPAYRRRLEFGDLEKAANRRKLGRFVTRRGRKFRDLGLPREETIRRIAEGPPTVGSALGIVFRAYAERFDAARWGDKRPAYHNHIPVLMRLFPDAQLVHIVRDPRDCVASLKRMRWWKRPSHHSVAVWAQSIDSTDAALRRWPGALVRVRYERLVADPESELRALCAALGEEYDPAMAEPERTAAVAVPERKRRHHHVNTAVAPTTSAIGKWRDGLEPWEVGLCERVLAGRMREFGYELSGLGRARPADVARYAAVYAGRRFENRKDALEDARKRRREPNPVASLLSSDSGAAEARG